LFVEPVPARAAELEIDDEVQPDASGNGIFEARIQTDAEVGGQDIAFISEGEQGVAGADVCCLQAG
jgi:hypothetical protein